MRVVLNMNSQGLIEVITDAPCEVFTVCDETPNDRVYRLTESHTVSRLAVDAALRDDPVGHSGDSRHEAIKQRILAAETGARHLKLVEQDEMN